MYHLIVLLFICMPSHIYAMEPENPYKKPNFSFTDSDPEKKERKNSPRKGNVLISSSIDRNRSESNSPRKRTQKDSNLIKAICKANTEIIDSILEGEINCIDSKHQRTPLMWAAINGDLNTVKKLLRFKELDINAQDSCGDTALHLAISAAKDINYPGQKYVIAKKILKDPRTRCTIPNNGNYFPGKYIQNGDEGSKLKRILFAHGTIEALFSSDSTIREEIFNLVLEHAFSKKRVSKSIIKHIKKTFERDYEAQEKCEDRKMPQDSQLPKYANSDFLKKMIKYEALETHKRNIAGLNLSFQPHVIEQKTSLFEMFCVELSSL